MLAAAGEAAATAAADAATAAADAARARGRAPQQAAAGQPVLTNCNKQDGCIEGASNAVDSGTTHVGWGLQQKLGSRPPARWRRRHRRREAPITLLAGAQPAPAGLLNSSGPDSQLAVGAASKAPAASRASSLRGSSHGCATSAQCMHCSALSVLKERVPIHPTGSEIPAKSDWRTFQPHTQRRAVPLRSFLSPVNPSVLIIASSCSIWVHQREDSSRGGATGCREDMRSLGALAVLLAASLLCSSGEFGLKKTGELTRTRGRAPGRGSQLLLPPPLPGRCQPHACPHRQAVKVPTPHSCNSTC